MQYVLLTKLRWIAIYPLDRVIEQLGPDRYGLVSLEALILGDPNGNLFCVGHHGVSEIESLNLSTLGSLHVLNENKISWKRRVPDIIQRHLFKSASL